MNRFAILRHGERADATWQRNEWLDRGDFKKWPNDPPLSEIGLSEARITAQQIGNCGSQQEVDSTEPHVVVSSPFMRCWQTAVEVCLVIGPSAVLLLDHSMGEVYGPDVFGDVEPIQLLRPSHEVQRYCNARGVKMMKTAVGDRPKWPEYASQARVRFLDGFFQYLRRSSVARRNFTIVTHADGVKTALGAMPAMRGRHVEHVGYGGYFVATLAATPRRSVTKRSCSVVPCGALELDTGFSDSVDRVPSCLNATSGWQVHVSSNVQLGPKAGEGFLTRLTRWSRQTKFSESSIQRLLQCSPKERVQGSRVSRGSEDSTASVECRGETCEAWRPLPSSLSGSNESSVSQSTLLFGTSEFSPINSNPLSPAMSMLSNTLTPKSNSTPKEDFLAAGFVKHSPRSPHSAEKRHSGSQIAHMNKGLLQLSALSESPLMRRRECKKMEGA